MIEEGYSICLNEWALDRRIKNELGLLLIISSLCAAEGHCFANNKYFADLFGADETTISKKIKFLIECGYLNVEYEKRGAEIIGRYLRLAKIPTDDWRKCQPTIGENAKGNIINNKNIIFKNIGGTEKKENLSIYMKKKIVVGKDFKIDFSDEYFTPYRNAGKKLAADVEQWIIKHKLGEQITKNFVCRQLTNFAMKQGKIYELAGVTINKEKSNV